MDTQTLRTKITLYKVAQILGLSRAAVSKWVKTNKIPRLRLYELKEKKPELFDENYDPVAEKQREKEEKKRNKDLMNALRKDAGLPTKR